MFDTDSSEFLLVTWSVRIKEEHLFKPERLKTQTNWKRPSLVGPNNDQMYNGAFASLSFCKIISQISSHDLIWTICKNNRQWKIDQWFYFYYLLLLRFLHKGVPLVSRETLRRDLTSCNMFQDNEIKTPTYCSNQWGIQTDPMETINGKFALCPSVGQMGNGSKNHVVPTLVGPSSAAQAYS